MNDILFPAILAFIDGGLGGRAGDTPFFDEAIPTDIVGIVTDLTELPDPYDAKVAT